MPERTGAPPPSGRLVTDPNAPWSPEPPRRRPRGSGAAIGLFVLGLIVVLYFGRDVILLILLPLMGSFVLLPVVRWLHKWVRLPRGVAAALVVLATCAAGGTALYLLVEPAVTWTDKLPQSIGKIERKFRPVKEKMQDVDRALDKAEELVDSERATKVKLTGQSLSDVVRGQASSLVTSLAIIVILLFFLLAGDDLFVRKLACLLPPESRADAAGVARSIERQVSRYLLTLSVIYIVLGSITAAAMWALGMPNPLLWGAIAAILGFIPYLGPLITVGIIAAAALLTFESTTDILLPPLVFAVITTAEGYFVTPYILGRRLSLDPVIILIALLFWGFLWGIPGALLTVPILVVAKIVCEQAGPRLQGLASFLGSGEAATGRPRRLRRLRSKGA